MPDQLQSGAQPVFADLKKFLAAVSGISARAASIAERRRVIRSTRGTRRVFGGGHVRLRCRQRLS